MYSVVAERVVNECLKEICLFDKFLHESISAKALSADDYISLGNKRLHVIAM